MKKKLTYSLFAILTVIVGVTIYSFLYGKLFPYSPIIVGFSQHEFAHTVVYVQHGADFTSFGRIDSLLSGVEQFHDLKFLTKPKIFIFTDNKSYFQRSFSKARFCVFDNSLVISPWALQEDANGEISLDIYLTHELSHVLLFQHHGFFAAFRYPAWLLEGIAVYSANQMGTYWYPSKEETYTAIQQGNFLPPFSFKTKQENLVSLDVPYRIPFMYSEFACLVEYLIQHYGKEKFLVYMNSVVDVRTHNDVFFRIYQMNFDDCLQNFQHAVMQHAEK